MHLNKKWLFIILGIFVLIIILFPKKVEYINYNVDSIKLTIYGLNDKPTLYNLDNNQLINPLVKNINSIIISKNEVGNREKVDLPKGVTYKLNFNGLRDEELSLVNGFCVYNDKVYKVDNYQMFILNLREDFGITEESVNTNFN